VTISLIVIAALAIVYMIQPQKTYAINTAENDEIDDNWVYRGDFTTQQDPLLMTEGAFLTTMALFLAILSAMCIYVRMRSPKVADFTASQKLLQVQTTKLKSYWRQFAFGALCIFLM
jgi:hypothetical protein